MPATSRRRRGARLIERTDDELVRPFRATDGAQATEEEASAPEPDPLETAHARGRQEGEAAVRAEADAQLERERATLRRELSEALAGLAELEHRVREETLNSMKQLALEAASRIVRERIDADDPIAARAVAEAVDALSDVDAITVRVHPDELEAIRDELAELVERGRIELQADERVGRGGCVAVSPAGSIDARLETAIDEVCDAAVGATAGAG